MISQLIFLFILILLNAYFAATEIAFISLNDAKIEKQAKDGNKKATCTVTVVNSNNNTGTEDTKQYLSFPYVIFNGTSSITVKNYTGSYKLYYQFVEVTDKKFSELTALKEEYKNASGTCYMDPRDMGKLGVKNWDTVLVKTEWGEVVVNAAVSRDAPHEGTVFICKGPWANTVVSPDTYCCSDPTYKGIHCTVEKTDREVLLMADLMRWVYKKYVDSDDDDVVEHMESLGERPVYKGRKWEELIDHDI